MENQPYDQNLTYNGNSNSPYVDNNQNNNTNQTTTGFPLGSYTIEEHQK